MEKYGTLLSDSIKLHRSYFKEMVRLNGIYVLYRAPKPNKTYTTYGEIEANYEEPILVGCLFNEHPKQQTMKKLGWMSELDEDASLIEVDYDLPHLQQGALFIVPSGIDNARGRLFRVVNLTTSMMYPASVTCKIVPEYEDTEVEQNLTDFTSSDFNALNVDDSMFDR